MPDLHLHSCMGCRCGCWVSAPACTHFSLKYMLEIKHLQQKNIEGVEGVGHIFFSLLFTRMRARKETFWLWQGVGNTGLIEKIG